MKIFSGVAAPVRQLDLRAHRMLLADWFANLASESGLKFNQHGTAWQAFTLGAPNAFNVTAHFIEEPPFLSFVASDPVRQGIVDAIAREAVRHAEQVDLGGGVWYTTQLHEVEFKLSPLSIMGPILQRLGGETRISGWRRLSSSVLLEFTEDLPADWERKAPTATPKAIVHVHIAAPGPLAGHLSSAVAHGAVETIAAICTFALGRSVALPPGLFPSKPEMLPQQLTTTFARWLARALRSIFSVGLRFQAETRCPHAPVVPC